MTKSFVPTIAKYTQAQVDAGAANSDKAQFIIVVDGTGNPISPQKVYQGTGNGTLPSAIATSAGVILNNFAATTAPATSNDSTQGYAVGSRWIDTVANESYVCTKATNPASWSQTTVGTIAEVAGLIGALGAKQDFIQKDANNGYAGLDATGKVPIARMNTDTTKQNVLVSGTNIKTVGGASIVGAGDVPMALTSVSTRLWLPSDAASAPTVWYKPDALLTAGALATWADSSANGNTATVSGSIGVTLNSLNGYSQVDFTGGRLGSASAIAMASGSSFAVIKEPAAPITNSNVVFGGSVAGDVGFIVGGSQNNFTLTMLNVTNMWGTNSTSALTANAWGLAGATWNSTTDNFYVEGKPAEAVSFATAFNATQIVRLGSQTASAATRTSPMAEVIIYGGAILGQSDMDKLAGYAAWKYGLQANLPIGHTYKNAAPTVLTLPTYVNNAAAITGGLTVGSLYRTNADPDMLSVVH